MEKLLTVCEDSHQGHLSTRRSLTAANAKVWCDVAESVSQDGVRCLEHGKGRWQSLKNTFLTSLLPFRFASLLMRAAFCLSLRAVHDAFNPPLSVRMVSHALCRGGVASRTDRLGRNRGQRAWRDDPGLGQRYRLKLSHQNNQQVR